MKTIAIDFDGVIHKYSRGYLDGQIYDEPIEGAFEFIQWCIENYYSVFIFSTRSPRQIKKWIEERTSSDRVWHYKFKPVVIPFWKKFWNERSSKPSGIKPVKVGITKRKLPAIIYIDDRACKFNGDWEEIYKKLN